jgi:GDP-L-fucose synthase
MKVVVTGGSGFLGTRLQLKNPDWIYISSKDADLTNYNECINLFNKYTPDAIIHLAAKVGGIKENATKPAEFYDINIQVNTNVLKASYKCGIKRVLSCLSTCTFPDAVSSYPFSEDNIFDGPPAITNRAYGFTKRALYIQTLAYREQYGVNYSCFCPSNLYGPNDNFDLESSHFVPALIRKLEESEDGDSLELWGTGNPKRQQLYVDDLAEIIPILLEKHNSDIPLIVAPNENFSIKEMADISRSIIGREITFTFNGSLDGQFRKDGSNEKFKELVPDFEFTSFKKGLKQTYEWFKERTR